MQTETVEQINKRVEYYKKQSEERQQMAENYRLAAMRTWDEFQKMRTVVENLRKEQRPLMLLVDDIAQIRARIKKQEELVKQHHTSYDELHKSLAWKMVLKFRGLKDQFLPKQSRQRRIYEKVIARVKAR